MRQSEYLSESEAEKEWRSMSGNEINEKVLGIKEFGEQVRKENILTILNHNDFFKKHGFFLGFSLICEVPGLTFWSQKWVQVWNAAGCRPTKVDAARRI